MVNYIGDAAKLFDTGYEKKIAKILNSGSHAMNISNYDERLLQKELIVNNSHTTDIIFIGSSRGMLLNSEMFPNASFFNRAVSGASIEDLIAIYQMYKSYNTLPHKIIIGIDPWTFNDNSGQTRWETLSNEFNMFINEPYHNTSYKYKQLISFSYFQGSIKYFFKGLTKNNYDNPQPSTKIDSSTTLRLADGSIWYGTDTYRISKEKIDAKVNTYLVDEIYALYNFNNLSERNLKLFESLIKDFKNNNIQIYFYLEPYHPLVYQRIKKLYPMVIETESLIRNYAMENHIKIIGSFNPFLFNLTDNSFYDGMHCKEDAVKQILEISNMQAKIDTIRYGGKIETVSEL
jgi:hypothetical protein